LANGADASTNVVLFAFAAGNCLTEHVAPFPAITLIVKGEAALTVGDESVAGKPGTCSNISEDTAQYQG